MTCITAVVLRNAHLRLASTSVAVSLLVVTWPEYFRYLTYIPNIVHHALIGFYKFVSPIGGPPQMPTHPVGLVLAPWRMDEAKEWFAV